MCSIHGGKYRIGEVCIECVQTVYNIEFNMSGNIRTLSVNVFFGRGI